MLLWAGSRTGQASSELCQLQVSASQGRGELALGRCWVIFCLSHSLIPVLVKAERTFLHPSCHGKGQSTAPGTVKRGGFEAGQLCFAVGCGCTGENIQGWNCASDLAWEQIKAAGGVIPATGLGKPLLLAADPYWAGFRKTMGEQGLLQPSVGNGGTRGCLAARNSIPERGEGRLEEEIHPKPKPS